MRVYMLSVACVGLSCYPCIGLAMGKLWFGQGEVVVQWACHLRARLGYSRPLECKTY